MNTALQWRPVADMELEHENGARWVPHRRVSLYDPHAGMWIHAADPAHSFSEAYEHSLRLLAMVSTEPRRFTASRPAW